MTEQRAFRLPEWAWVLWLCLLCLFLVAPLTLPGYHWGAHDARHSVYFLFEFDRGISDGILYPRWAPDFTFGYGYPFFNIYGPLSSYLGEGFHLLGFDLVTATEMVFGLAAIASALAMYLWLRLYCQPPGALLGALLYAYAPYHIVDLYVRASLAETVAMVFLPLCLWAFCRLQQCGNARRLVVAGVCYAGLMFSSNPLALLFSPILGGYILVLCLSTALAARQPGQKWASLAWQTMRALIPHALAVGLGLCLSAIFWIPALLEYKYIRTDQWVGGYYDYQNHFVSLYQLFLSNWGFGGSVPGPDDGMSFQLGLAPLALALFGLLSWRKLDRRWRLASGYFLAVTGVFVFLMLPQSVGVWQAIGLVSFAQFPWRLLALTVLSLAFLGASAASGWSNDQHGALLAALFSLLVILSVYPYLHANIRPATEGEVSLAGLMRFQQSADEMTGSTAWVQKIPRWSPLADQTMSGIKITTKVDYAAVYSTGKLAVDSRGMGTTYEKVWFQADDDNQRIRFLTFYYPGWTAYILDGKGEKVEAIAPTIPDGELGLITVPVPQGQHMLLLVFKDTPLRRLSAGLTLASAAFCILIVPASRLRWRRK